MAHYDQNQKEVTNRGPGQPASAATRPPIPVIANPGPGDRFRRNTQQDQVSVSGIVVAVHGDVHLVQQGAQQLLAVLIGGGRRVPDGLQVVAEGQDRGALGAGERGGTAPPVGAKKPGTRPTNR